ncbi:putative transcription factor WRKY family [Helianthus annuus]|uniref:Putative WRKY domain-containing protein n=1 Tax=Helianthus annuus TaxID=4232 RepID=A0A251TS91_HELAN|nr:probable WRKY transcription factor 17 [Helianthus annuus]KAF5789550.1 putative transcription factor WRKY family [Helianthus annuus]KAJ0532886.1 putative transcription factor WRKY family [Helianthus annuus]KAJ0541283.1 putative transcription factor WRKY family [Helianthus annuus]KAJ0706364.1 putative transcription factor WRKY family [Helianthus annuus]KAJ0886889.1 putative transcription factor WRKY family [Helianthus annuus]
MAVDYVGVQPVDHLNHMFHLSSTSYNKTISTLKRTGHARFRRAPSTQQPDSNEPSTSSQSEKKQVDSNISVTETTSSSSSRSTSSSSDMMTSSGLLEITVSNGKHVSSLGIVAPAPVFSSRKPPLPATHRKRCIADRPVADVHRSGSGCHHCCKRRKIGSKRDIRRVPIIGSKVTSIPADDYSWKKYGEKKIDGSSYPRVYYKCSSGKGCRARKRVELAADDAKMLLVTYDGEHNHRRAPTPVPTGLTGLVGC